MTTRLATRTDTARLAELIGGTENRINNIAFKENTRPIVVTDNNNIVACTILFLKATDEPIMGAVGLDQSLSIRNRLLFFHELLVAVAQECLNNGFTHGIADLVTVPEFVGLARRYGMEIEPIGINIETGEPGHYRIRANCESLVLMKSPP